MGNTLTVGESGWRVWGGESGGVESGADSLGAWSLGVEILGMKSLELESLGWRINLGAETTLVHGNHDHLSTMDLRPLLYNRRCGREALQNIFPNHFSGNLIILFYIKGMQSN